MKIIDSDNYAASGIETMFFPGGEPHVKVPKFSEEVLFYGKLRSWSDVGFAALVLNTLRQQQSDLLRVLIPYFPGARQDRSDGTAPITLAVMMELLTSDDQILHVFDAHSSALGDADNVVSLFWQHLGHQIPVNDKVSGIIAPDKGAIGRATMYRDFFHPATDIICASKHRNAASGHLSGYQLPSLTKRGHYVIVDDICDGGGTFNLLMEAALADPIGADSTFDLIVSHGIFSKGLEGLHPRIAHITTTDSWCQLPSDDRLTVIKLDSLIPWVTEY